MGDGGEHDHFVSGFNTNMENNRNKLSNVNLW